MGPVPLKNIGVILGFYWGYIGVYIRVILGLYWGCIEVMYHSWFGVSASISEFLLGFRIWRVGLGFRLSGLGQDLSLRV